MMLAARGIFLAARRKPKLPYDAEVEYIGAQSGTARVEFLHACSPETVIYFDCEVLPNATANSISFGYTWISEARNFLLGCANNAEGLYLDFGSGYGYKRISMFAPNLWKNRRMKLECGNNYMRDRVSGTEVSGQTQTFSPERYEGKPFRVSCAPTGRIYGFSLADGSQIVDLIPVRFTNELGQSEGAMYDKVSGQLFRNQGTGAFSWGADKTA